MFCLLWPTVGGLRELWHVDRCLLWPTVVIRVVSACARGSALSLASVFMEGRRVYVYMFMWEMLSSGD